MGVSLVVAARFWPKVDKRSDGECWNWIAGLFTAGYGALQVGGKPMYAHRLSYEMAKGDIPQGMVVRHSCDNPRCVNPGHLLIGTPLDNIRDKVERGRSGCSDATRKKLSAINAGRPSSNRKAVSYMGREFVSLTEAAAAFGVSIPTIRKRIHRASIQAYS